MALLGALLAMHGLLFWGSWHLARQGYADFTIFYTAGTIVRLGLGNHLYDDALQYRVQQSFASGVEIRKGPLPYNHPAYEALLFVPLSLLDYPTAYAVWDLISLASLAAVPFILRPHIPLLQRASPLLWLLVLIAFFPVLAVLMQGQDAILCLLLYALAFAALKSDAEILAGAWLGLGMFRFHLVIPLVVILLCWKYRKTVRSLLVTTSVLAIVSIAITGWHEVLRYPRYVFHLEGSLGHAAIFPSVMPNLRGLLEGWPGVRDFPIAIHAVVIALSLCLALWVVVSGRCQEQSNHQFDLRFSLATVTTVLVSYHAYAYDLSLLVIPVLVVASYVLESPTLQWSSRMSSLLLLPMGVLFCTPLYVWLGFRAYQLNLFAPIELLWLWGIRNQIAATTPIPTGKQPVLRC